jgi:hypothetical protein
LDFYRSSLLPIFRFGARDFGRVSATLGNRKNGGHGSVHAPFASSFVREDPAPAAPAPAREPAGDTPLIVDGQEYVAGSV